MTITEMAAITMQTMLRSGRTCRISIALDS
jgi:hypothetical protein